MRNVIVLTISLIVASTGFAQATQRANLRTRRVSAEEEKFNQDNPSGTNEFNRTFCQQVSYNKAFAPKHFLGFEFGKKYESYGQNLKLAKPFRMFDTITLYHSDLDNLSLVELKKDIENVSLESAIAEVDKVANLLRRKYQIEFCHWKGDGSYHFDNDYSEITISCFTYKGRATGLFLSIRNKAVGKRDYDEKLKADSKRQAAIDIPVDAGADLLSVDKPNVELVVKKEIEENVKCMAEAERKKAIAHLELDGWPCAVKGDPFMLSVYGTNVQNAVGKCCEVELELFSAPEFRRMRISDATSFSLYLLCEKECHVVFSSEHTAVAETAWKSEKGTCLIDNFDTDYWRKYDECGRLVKWGHFTKFEEYVWVTNRHVRISARLREVWAKKHGLTLEQAEKQAKELIETIDASPRGGLLGGSLRARRQMREQRAKDEADKARREAEAERAEQRQQLQAIQEELKRVREAKAAAKITDAD